jgi:hypothetical protein
LPPVEAQPESEKRARPIAIGARIFLFMNLP